MNEIQLRKQALLLESQLNRLDLQNEMGQLCQAGSWSDRLAKLRSKLSPWMGIMAAVAGAVPLIGFRRSIKSLSWLTKSIALLPPLIQLWRSFTTRTDEEFSEQPDKRG